MRMVDLIIKKRDGHELSDEEIRFWISGYAKGDIPDYQSSAMQMAILFKGMSHREVSTLTDAMEHSGDTLDLSMLKGVKVDKHSTGGVGDKTTRSWTNGRCLWRDFSKAKWSWIRSHRWDFRQIRIDSRLTIAISGQRFIDQVNSIGIAVAGQTKSLVPADKKCMHFATLLEPLNLFLSSPLVLCQKNQWIPFSDVVGEGAGMDDANWLTVQIKCLDAYALPFGYEPLGIMA